MMVCKCVVEKVLCGLLVKSGRICDILGNGDEWGG
jgi:hypothetical protein